MAIWNDSLVNECYGYSANGFPKYSGMPYTEFNGKEYTSLGGYSRDGYLLFPYSGNGEVWGIEKRGKQDFKLMPGITDYKGQTVFPRGSMAWSAICKFLVRRERERNHSAKITCRVVIFEKNINEPGREVRDIIEFKAASHASAFFKAAREVNRQICHMADQKGISAEICFVD